MGYKRRWPEPLRLFRPAALPIAGRGVEHAQRLHHESLITTSRAPDKNLTDCARVTSAKQAGRLNKIATNGLKTVPRPRSVGHTAAFDHLTQHLTPNHQHIRLGATIGHGHQPPTAPSPHIPQKPVHQSPAPVWAPKRDDVSGEIDARTLDSRRGSSEQIRLDATAGDPKQWPFTGNHRHRQASAGPE